MLTSDIFDVVSKKDHVTMTLTAWDFRCNLYGKYSLGFICYYSGHDSLIQR